MSFSLHITEPRQRLTARDQAIPGRGRLRRRPRTTPRPGARRFTGLWFVLPGFALYALVMLYPAARALDMSLRDFAIVPGRPSPFIGLRNYAAAVSDAVLRRSFVNAAFYTAVTVPAQMVIGMFLAVLLDAKLPGRTIFRVLFYLPVVTSWVVVSLLFQYLFASDGGFVNWVLVDVLHVLGDDVNWLGGRWTTMFTVSLLGIWKGVGWSMLIFLAALSGVPRELYEAAAIDGARPRQRFRHVTLPLISGAIATVGTLLLIGGFNAFTSILLMVGSDPLNEKQVPLTYMYRQAFNFLDFGYGAAISFLLTGVVLALAGLQYFVTHRRATAVLR